jgi:hypothetical protein
MIRVSARIAAIFPAIDRRAWVRAWCAAAASSVLVLGLLGMGRPWVSFGVRLMPSVFAFCRLLSLSAATAMACGGIGAGEEPGSARSGPRIALCEDVEEALGRRDTSRSGASR